jgi:hypothetical protein
MIYYPGFEIKDEKWLKFALLYLDKVQPIIPESGLSFLSKKAKIIMNETDLIEPYIIGGSEGMWASQRATNQFDEYLKNPERYIPGNFCNGRLSKMYNTERWQNECEQQFILFSEKYSRVFENYCIDNKIAHYVDYGLGISEELAYIYMSFLADEISSKYELDAITDHFLSNQLLLNNYKGKRRIKNLKIIQKSLELDVPMSLENIDIYSIIKLRSKTRFNDMRKIYIRELEKYFSTNKGERINEIDNRDILLCSKEIGNMIKSFLKTILSTVVISMFSIEASLIATAINIVPEVLSVSEEGKNFASSLKRFRNKRSAKKYLVELNRLK